MQVPLSFRLWRNCKKKKKQPTKLEFLHSTKAETVGASGLNSTECQPFIYALIHPSIHPYAKYFLMILLSIVGLERFPYFEDLNIF